MGLLLGPLDMINSFQLVLDYSVLCSCVCVFFFSSVKEIQLSTSWSKSQSETAIDNLTNEVNLIVALNTNTSPST